MKLTITIEMDNAAFLSQEEDASDEDHAFARGEEVERILGDLGADYFRDGIDHSSSVALRDSNGNRVGEAVIKAD